MERRGDKDIQIDPAISLKGLRFSIEGRRILDGIDLDLLKGRSYLVLGRNGSGKTTLLKIMAGLLWPYDGDVYLFGERVREPWDLRSRTGYVFQNPLMQIVGSTVEEDLAFGLENMGVPSDEMEERIEKMLEFVELKPYRFSDPLILSGGQIQRLAIASVLILEPDVVLLDEPLGMLDAGGRKEVMDLVEKMKDSGKTVVMATHDLERIDVFDFVIYMESGTARTEKLPEFFSDPPEDIPKVWE